MAKLPSVLRNSRFILASAVTVSDRTICIMFDESWKTGNQANFYDVEMLRKYALQKENNPLNFDQLKDAADVFEDFYYNPTGRYIIIKFGCPYYYRYKTYIILDDNDFFRC